MHLSRADFPCRLWGVKNEQNKKRWRVFWQTHPRSIQTGSKMSFPSINWKEKGGHAPLNLEVLSMRRKNCTARISLKSLDVCGRKWARIHKLPWIDPEPVQILGKKQDEPAWIIDTLREFEHGKEKNVNNRTKFPTCNSDQWNWKTFNEIARQSFRVLDVPCFCHFRPQTKNKDDTNEIGDHIGSTQKTLSTRDWQRIPKSDFTIAWQQFQNEPLLHLLRPLMVLSNAIRHIREAWKGLVMCGLRKLEGCKTTNKWLDKSLTGLIQIHALCLLLSRQLLMIRSLLLLDFSPSIRID